MPGLTFLDVLFLGGLAAAALPVIIHLLHRRPAKRVDFSWLRFIRRLEPRRTRRVRMEEVLLLAVRILLLVCVALALARPALRGGVLGSGGSRARTTACIVLDDSYSMGTRSGDALRFDQARARALEVLSLLKPGDDAMLLLGRDLPVPVVGEPVQDLAYVGRRIEALEVSAHRGDPARALREGARLLAASPNLNREMYFITDSQAGPWASDTSRVVLDPSLSLYWVSVGPPPESNVSLDRVEPVDALGGMGAPVMIQAVVRNHGPEARPSLLVELTSGGEVQDQALVNVEAHAQAAVLLRMTPPAGGPASGEVRVAADALPLDDVRYFVLSGERPVRALVLSEDTARPGGRGAAFYISRALDPEGNGSSGIRVRETRPGEIASSDLDTADIVVLADLPRLEPAKVDLLARFVERGGGLLIVAGPSMDLGFYNRSLLPEFLDLTLDGPRGEEGGAGFFRMRGVRSGHPALAALTGDLSAVLEEVRFRRVMGVTPGENASVLAEFAGAGPAIVEGAGLAGRVLFFASSGDPAWSDFPLSGAFVPWLHEVAQYLAAGVSREGSYPVGGSASRVLDGAGSGGVVGIDPLGVEVLLEPEVLDGRPRVRWDGLEHPGVCRLRWGETEVDRFAVNVSTEEESVPSVLDERSVRARVSSERVRVVKPGEALETQVAALRYGRELGSAFLWAALGLFALESWLIRGRGKGDSAAAMRREIFR